MSSSEVFADCGASGGRGLREHATPIDYLRQRFSAVNGLMDVEPKDTVPSRTHLTSTLKTLFKACRKELAELLNRQDGVALRTDGWTSKAVESFIT